MVLADSRTSAGCRRHRTKRQTSVRICRMPEQEPQDLAARVSARAGHRH
jgi:hypothetical protein